MDFNNIGKKIKNFAETFFRICTVFSIILGIAIAILGLVFGEEALGDWAMISAPIIGALEIFVGIFSSYVISMFLYGFGELVDNSAAWKRTESNSGNKAPEKPSGARINTTKDNAEAKAANSTTIPQERKFKYDVGQRVCYSQTYGSKYGTTGRITKCLDAESKIANAKEKNAYLIRMDTTGTEGVFYESQIIGVI